MSCYSYFGCCIANTGFNGLGNFIAPNLLYIPGWVLLVAGICGIYLASAIVVNDSFGRTIYPNPGPLVKDKDGSMLGKMYTEKYSITK